MERVSSGVCQIIAADMVSAFQNGVLCIFSGVQPQKADNTENGTLLCVITKNGDSFTAGQPDNGLNLVIGNTSGLIEKDPDEVWTGQVIANGTPGWFRFYDNNYNIGPSLTAKRFDGSIGTAVGDEIQLSKLALYEEDTIDILSFRIHIADANG